MKPPTVECLGIYLKLQTYLIAHRMIWMMSRSHLMLISLNLVLAGLRLGLKNRQVDEKWVSDDCSYLCKGLNIYSSFIKFKNKRKE
jgi:hypothetical protein